MMIKIYKAGTEYKEKTIYDIDHISILGDSNHVLEVTQENGKIECFDLRAYDFFIS